MLPFHEFQLLSSRNSTPKNYKFSLHKPQTNNTCTGKCTWSWAAGAAKGHLLASRGVGVPLAAEGPGMGRVNDPARTSRPNQPSVVTAVVAVVAIEGGDVGSPARTTATPSHGRMGPVAGSPALSGGDVAAASATVPVGSKAKNERWLGLWTTKQCAKNTC